MSERAITGRVGFLGEKLGLFELSAHDCRHYWATSAARHGTDPFALQEAGGWSSLAMPRKYIEDNKIANQNVKLE
jgi:integrase